MKILGSGVVFFIVCMVLFVECRQGVTPLVYQVPLKQGLKTRRVLEMNEYVDSIRYIALETTDSCFIGDIYKIECWNNLFYVRDLNENLYVFDEQGRFLRQIGIKGRGPEEYQVLTDFSVDPANGDIYLIDVGKIVVYSKEGTWKRSVKIDMNWQVCTFDETGNLIFISPLGGKKDPFHLITICDREGKMIKQLSGEPVRVNVGLFNWINQQEGKVFYKEEFSDTLFYLDSGFCPQPYACIDFGEYKFTPDLLDMKMVDRWSSHYRLIGLYDFNNSMVLNVQRGLLDQDLESYLFDKQRECVGILGKSGSKEFSVDGVVCWPRGSRDNELICVISPAYLAGNPLRQEGFLKKVADDLKEDSNPVLAILYMK